MFLEHADYSKIERNLLQNYAVLVVEANKDIKISADQKIAKKVTYWERNETIILYLTPSTTKLRISYKELTPLIFAFPEELEAGKIYSARVNVEKIKKGSNYAQSTSAITSSDIRLSDFRINPQVLLGSVNPVYDNAGQPCAVIRYFVNDDNFIMEPNLGVLKTVTNPGQIIQYVPTGTKRLTVRNQNFMPLSGYDLPVDLEPKMTYDVTVTLIESAIRRQKASPDHDTYLGIGYNGTMIFTANGNHQSFTIHCNSAWEISAPSWCKLSETSGNGNKEIKVNARVNMSAKKRSGIIAIHADGVTATINVEQKGE